MIKKTILIFTIFIISSCSSKIYNFESYLPQPFPKTNFMPDSDMVAGKPSKVVVFELDEGKNTIAKRAGLGEVLTINLENSLTKHRLAELVDRKIATKLKKEITLAEMNKTGSYKGPIIADYAISGAISEAGFNKKYSSGFIIPDGKGGITKTKPKFTYTGSVAGNIKIYELPSMQVIETFEFSGKESRSEDVKTDNNISIAGLIEFGGQKTQGLERDDNLVREAGKEAIESIEIAVKNFFAQRGFILEKRVFKNKTIFKISVGSSNGIKTGDKFIVIGKYEIQNAITNEIEIEDRIIAQGKVSNKINPKFSWVIIEDDNVINSIRLGDAVRFQYQKSWLNKIQKLADNYGL